MSKVVGFYKDKTGKTRPITRKKRKMTLSEKLVLASLWKRLHIFGEGKVDKRSLRYVTGNVYGRRGKKLSWTYLNYGIALLKEDDLIKTTRGKVVSTGERTAYVHSDTVELTEKGKQISSILFSDNDLRGNKGERFPLERTRR
jgi:hypothetical protein